VGELENSKQVAGSIEGAETGEQIYDDVIHALTTASRRSKKYIRETRRGKERRREETRRDKKKIQRLYLFVPASAPKLVEAGASNDESGVELQPVRAKGGRLEVLPEAFDVTLEGAVRQIGHHVGDDLAQEKGQQKWEERREQ